MPNTPLIQNDEVYLRLPTQDDCDQFISQAIASRELHAPWMTTPQTAEEYEAYFNHFATPQHISTFLFKNEELLGVVNLGNIVRGGLQSGFLGYYIFASAAKQGYMTQGIQLMQKYAFETMGLHRLEANIQPGNIASIALIKRCGFRHEGFSPKYLQLNGVWCDHERFAITVEDYSAK